MKRILKWFVSVIGILSLLVVIAALSLWIRYHLVVGAQPGQMEVPAEPGKLGRWVNPFIGTGGIPWVCGNNFPGAAMPYGMVRLSPETTSMIINKKALNTSGYYYPDGRIVGFSHTRLAGTGATDGGHFLITPTAENFQDGDSYEEQCFSYSHTDEKAFPGYYAVRLAAPEVLTELTASTRVGVHRYTFSTGRTSALLIKITNTLGDKRSEEGEVEILPVSKEVQGSVRTFGSFAGRYGGVKLYFVARFNQAFSRIGTWSKGTIKIPSAGTKGDDIGAYLDFSGSNKKIPLLLKLAVSYISIANARENLEQEVGDLDFDEVLEQTKQAWEDKLSSIKIMSSDKKIRTIFYSALYHAMQMPTVFEDANGEYFGFDRRVHQADYFNYYTDLSLWDTFRNVHPLFILIDRQAQRDMLVSLVEMSKQGGGWLPRWPSGNGYTNSMLGTPADMVIAESYLKGIRDFDVQTAYQAMRRTALEATRKGEPFSGREGIEAYLRYNYCPAELMPEAVSRTLEFAYADYSISLLADALGYESDAKLFLAHSKYYKNVWNPETQYFQPRDTLGYFVQKFDPLMLSYVYGSEAYTNDYVEGSALQWRWAVPFDPNGLISLFKSRDYFISELNDFFALSDPARGEWNPGSYYWHGNEPDIYAAYLFNDAGRPDLTQKWVCWIMENKYSDTYDGLDGNDDAGTLSAWYVFSALGFYPLAGTDIYQIGSPLVEQAEINLGEHNLKIICDNYAPENIYVHHVWLNDSLLNRTWFRHDEIAGGGQLRFEMNKYPLEKYNRE